jgi:hypothetical protein
MIMRNLKLHTESFVEYSEKLDTHVEVDSNFIVIGRGEKRRYVDVNGSGQYDLYDCSLVRFDLSISHEIIAVKSGEKPLDSIYTGHEFIETVIVN